MADMTAPHAARAAVIMKLEEKLPLCSASIPATAGAEIWPREKMKVIKPKTLAALCGPARSPAMAAMIEGIAQAVIPKQPIEA